MKYLVVLLAVCVFWDAVPLWAQENEGSIGIGSYKGGNPIDTTDYLKAFHNDPKRVMNSPLLKRDLSGRIVEAPVSPFEMSGISEDEALEARDSIREEICRVSGRKCDGSDHKRDSRFAAITEKNQVTLFLYEPTFLRNLLDMENANLLQVTLKTAPWSDSFWPMAKGLIGRRWVDSAFPDTNTWIDNYNYILSVPAYAISPDMMSPSEKYDVLVGDGTFKLTENMWNSGKVYNDKYGKVPSWQGLCHGWAPASFMHANPERSVTVLAANGQRITFYPSDIKALASLAWGNAYPPVNFAGERCKVNHPQEDSVGRVIDEKCFDVNPATWHIGVVNQLGVNKRSFVFDATYDFQVWNYPVYAYQYSYFNPQTLATSKKLAGSMVALSDFTIDKFKTYRSPDARYVVGVSMDLTYAIPTSPSSKPVAKSTFHTVRYVYDLELDAGGNIIGGEWYSNFHPDFIWNPPPNGRTISAGEKQLSAEVVWDGIGPVPPELRNVADISSSKSQPLAAIVETLVRLAGPVQPAPPPAPAPTPVVVPPAARVSSGSR